MPRNEPHPLGEHLYRKYSSSSAAVFTQLLTETLTEDYCTLQMKNLKLNLDYKVFHIITVKIRENDLNDVLSELSIKETIKESLEK